MQRLQSPAVLDEFVGQPLQQFRTGWPIASCTEVVDRSYQAPSEVVLPDAVYNPPRYERSGTVIEVRRPLRERAALLSGISPAPICPGGRPVLHRGTVPAEDRQESQLHRLAFGAEISGRQ